MADVRQACTNIDLKLGYARQTGASDEFADDF